MAKKEHKIILGLDARKFRSQMDNVQQSFKGLNTAVKGFATLWGAQIAGQAIFDMGKLGAEVVNVSAAFERLDNPTLLDNLKKSTDGLVTDLELMKQSIKFQNFGLPVKQLGTFLQFAAKQARETGQSIDYLVESLTIGLGRQSIKVLDNLQIDILQFKENFKETGSYADALAKTIEQMGGDAMPDAVDQAQKLQVEFQNLKDQLARDILPLMNKILSITQKWVKGIKLLVGSKSEVLVDIARTDSALQKLARDLAKRFKGEQIDFIKFDESKLAAYEIKISKIQKKIAEGLKKIDRSPLGTTEQTVQDVAVWKEVLSILVAQKDQIKEQIASQQQIEMLEKQRIARLEKIVTLQSKGTPGMGDQTAGIKLRPTLMDPEPLIEITQQMETLAYATGGVAEGLINAGLAGESFGDTMINMLKRLAVQLAATAAVAGVLAALSGGGICGVQRYIYKNDGLWK